MESHWSVIFIFCVNQDIVWLTMEIWLKACKIKKKINRKVTNLLKPKQCMNSQETYRLRGVFISYLYICKFTSWQACPIGPEANILEPSEAQCRRIWLEQPILSLADLEVIKYMDHKGWKVCNEHRMWMFQ